MRNKLKDMSDLHEILNNLASAQQISSANILSDLGYVTTSSYMYNGACTTDANASNYLGNYEDLSDDEKEDLEILKMVKGYLAAYLQKILDDPDSVIEEAIGKEVDKKINKEYEDKIKVLENETYILKQRIQELERIIEEMRAAGGSIPGTNVWPWYPYTGPILGDSTGTLNGNITY